MFNARWPSGAADRHKNSQQLILTESVILGILPPFIGMLEPDLSCEGDDLDESTANPAAVKCAVWSMGLFTQKSVRVA
jgi:hypothetical protein